jgi:predicted dehydrogenase
MLARIAIVGVGNLGARHLQSLAQVDSELAVDIVDPSEASRDRGLEILAQSGGLRNGVVRGFSDVDQLPASPDLAIVATNSIQRPKAVETLVRAGTQRMVLEKVLFTRLRDYEDANALFSRSGIRAWVNCGRRFSPRAMDVASMLKGKPFVYKVEGAGWGLGCNVIHHIDEFASLAGSDDVSLSEDRLDREIVPSKRSGYIEFTGTLTGKGANGCRFSAHCSPGEFSGREVGIATDDLSLNISQTKQTLTVSDRSGTRTEPFPIPLQSEVTARHVTDILEGREPALPSYASAARLHRAMLTAFLSHLRRVSGNPDIDECPIT